MGFPVENTLFSVLELKPRAFLTLGKYSATKLYLQPWRIQIFEGANEQLKAEDI